ncbi:hypothetical protein IAE19_16015 [Acinetobacter sp. S40]|uniref:virulence factor TspB C-terminal domain-related protein n=1 Tax=Acinetobacter sp. S40 TaxID=2767434 RepID=UPI00190DB51E|nr:virulence factor TspB C-terminal domain-related protein [Acinetobacter sp. S40]MBJ9986928.1 hypothetical protein [Acinetobacter sp. S40]MBJ9986936.1 hypothetical protein [Acinetobacter sp. S40]
MFKKIKILLIFLLILLTSNLHAADRDEYWLQRDISIGQGRNEYGKKVYGQSARSIMQNVTIENSTKEEVRQLIKRSIAVDKPSAAKVGPSMLKRLYSPQAIVGTAAVSGLLAAIGWVMEDGIYVKKVPEEDTTDPNSQYLYYGQDGKYYSSAKAACDSDIALKSSSQAVYDSLTLRAGTTNQYVCRYYRKKYDDYDATIIASKPNPNYDPNKEPKLKTVPLTGALLGAAMIGRGYKDPDPNFNNDSVNTDDYTGVKEIYEHDPSGVGDEVADDMDDKLKNAKPTDDGKRSWIGDSRYSDEPTNDKDRTQDRSWSDSGDEATGETTPKTDPETGEQTGGSSITIQFPVFCSWAAKMCQWYDDWKVSDKRDTKFQEKVQEHYDDEKSFWDKVKDFFDWTKDESDLPERDDTDLNITSDFEEKKVSLNVSAQCPAPTYETVTLHGVTAQVKTSDYSFICSLDWLIKPFVIGFSMITACFILFGFQRGGEE